MPDYLFTYVINFNKETHKRKSLEGEEKIS
jgi:hypothetical protein